jgi:hypothetical protein
MLKLISTGIEQNYKQPRSQALPGKVNHNFSITLDQMGDWTANIPQKVEIVSENQAPVSKKSKPGTVALDPGVRVFQTLYTPEGYVMECGTRNFCVNIFNFSS